MWGHLDALNALIAAGADLNAQNHIRNDYGSDHSWGGTPLHIAANSRKACLYKRYRCAQRLIDAGLLPRGTRVFQGAGGQYRRDLHAQAEEHRCMLAYGLAKGNCYLSFRSKAEFVEVYHKLLLHLAEAPADGAFRLDDANFYEQMYLVRHQPPPRLPVPQI